MTDEITTNRTIHIPSEKKLQAARRIIFFYTLDTIGSQVAPVMADRIFFVDKFTAFAVFPTGYETPTRFFAHSAVDWEWDSRMVGIAEDGLIFLTHLTQQQYARMESLPEEDIQGIIYQLREVAFSIFGDPRVTMNVGA